MSDLGNKKCKNIGQINAWRTNPNVKYKKADVFIKLNSKKNLDSGNETDDMDIVQNLDSGNETDDTDIVQENSEGYDQKEDC